MLDPQEMFIGYLAGHGLKNTPQRRLIVQVFFDSDKHMTTEELYESVRAKDAGIGQATVYRTLKLLTEAKLAKEMHFGDGTARYEPAVEDTHHDHLICTACGKNTEVLDDTIEKLQEALAEKHGFTLTSHRMYLYGICNDCGRTARQKMQKSVDEVHG